MVRSAAALSALSGTPFRMENIRAGRERPGLRPSTAPRSGRWPGHAGAGWMDAVPTAANCGSSPGLSGRQTLNSRSVRPEHPSRPPGVAPGRSGDRRIPFGHGGTEVPGAPTIEYFLHVLLPVLTSHGARVEAEVKRRGITRRRGTRGGGGPAVPDQADRSGQGHLRDLVLQFRASRPRHRTAGGLGLAEDRTENGTEVTGHPGSAEGPGTGSSCTVFLGCKGVLPWDDGEFLPRRWGRRRQAPFLRNSDRREQSTGTLPTSC